MIDRYSRTAHRSSRSLERRRYAVLLLGLLVMSIVTNFEASLCMPGMAMGDDAPMGSMVMEDAASGGAHCGTLVGTSDDGTPLCPFAVGGVGPCGTAPPVPVQATYLTVVGSESTAQPTLGPTQISRGVFRVPTPPPRV